MLKDRVLYFGNAFEINIEFYYNYKGFTYHIDHCELIQKHLSLFQALVGIYLKQKQNLFFQNMIKK